MSQQRVIKIRELLTTALQPTQLEIIDDGSKHIGHVGAESGAGHFTVIIASTAFNNKTRIQQHRLVHDALKSMLEDEIHALAIKIVD